jgi:hypothetical protein
MGLIFAIKSVLFASLDTDTIEELDAIIANRARRYNHMFLNIHDEYA